MNTQPTQPKLTRFQRILAWLLPVRAEVYAKLANKTEDVEVLKGDVELLRQKLKDNEAKQERERIDRQMRHKSQLLLASLTAESWRRPEELLDAGELAAAFDVDADNDLWLALHQLLDVAIQEAVEESSQPPAGGKVTADDRTFAAGGVDFLRDFQRTLIEQRAKARAKAAEAETQEKE